MSKPFDAATKRLVESQPTAWLEYLGLPGTASALIDADLTTVTAEADRILRVEADVPYLAHIEFQSSYETDMDERILRYNVLIYHRHRIPVQSVVVLLRPQADGPEISGTAGYRIANSSGLLSFQYHVVRVWEKPVEEVLAGGLATLPLAPLADVSLEALPEVVRHMEARMDREAPPGEAGILWTATYLLMGLRYERAVIHQLLRGVRGMKESTTYREILEEGEILGLKRGLREGEARGLVQGKAAGRAEGKAEEARGLLLLLGTKRFGLPDAPTQAILEAITSLERLEQLAERLLEVENWQELLS